VDSAAVTITTDKNINSNQSLLTEWILHHIIIKVTGAHSMGSFTNDSAVKSSYSALEILLKMANKKS